MTSPIDRLLDGVDWRCTICGERPGCDCWERRKADALEYIGWLAERCGCPLPGGGGEPCGCSPVCECHTITEDEAAKRGARLRGRERAG